MGNNKELFDLTNPKTNRLFYLGYNVLFVIGYYLFSQSIILNIHNKQGFSIVFLVFINALNILEIWAVIYQTRILAYHHQKIYNTLPNFKYLNDIVIVFFTIIKVILPLIFLNELLKNLNFQSNEVTVVIFFFVFLAKEIYIAYHFYKPQPSKPITSLVILSTVILLLLQIVYSYIIVGLVSNFNNAIDLNIPWIRIIMKTLVIVCIFLFLFLPYRLVQSYREIIFLKSNLDYLSYVISWLFILTVTLNSIYKPAKYNTWSVFEQSIQKAQQSKSFECKDCIFKNKQDISYIKKICTIQQLKSINLKNLNFNLVPACFFEIPTLEILDFADINIYNFSLPFDTKIYTKAIRLEKLMISTYHDINFPYQLKHLPQLKYLKIGTPHTFNQTEQISWISSLKELPNLKVLYLNDIKNNQDFKKLLASKMENLEVILY
jgi:hypothetical protein